jgi:hypothetical protein
MFPAVWAALGLLYPVTGVYFEGDLLIFDGLAKILVLASFSFITFSLHTYLAQINCCSLYNGKINKIL